MISRRKRNLAQLYRVAVFSCALPYSCLFAQQTSVAERLSLRDALAQSIARNPLVDAAQNKVESATGMKVQASLKPNPRLTVVNENARAWELSTPFRFAHGTDTWIYASQTVERGGKLQRRLEYTAAGIERAQAEKDLTAVQIQGRVAAAYWDAAVAAKIVELYRQDLSAFAEIVEYNRQRVKEGAQAGADLLRIEIEQDHLMATAKRAQQDADLTRIALLREMGRGDFPELQFTDALEALTTPAIVFAEDAFRNRQDLRAAEGAVREQEKNIALQKANAAADPEWGFGYKRTAGLDGLYLGLNIPLPVRNRNQGNIATAEAEARSARNLALVLRNQIRAEIEAAQRDYTSKKAALEETILPLRGRSREVERIAQIAYREGGVELLRFLDAERNRIETDVLYYRSLAEVQQSILTLRLAQGEKL